MTGKTQAMRQPSIDELLASIREAIHERVSEKPARSASSGDDPSPACERHDPAPPQADDRPLKRTIVTSNQNGFAGLLGGEVRLEEALARLNQTGSRQRSEAPRVPEMAEEAAGAVAQAPSEPRLRPSIAQWTGGLSAPAPVEAAAPDPVEPAPQPVVPEPVAQDKPSPEPAPTAADRLAEARKRVAAERASLWKDRPKQDEPRAAPRSTERFARAAPAGNLASSFSSTSKPESDDLLSSQAASAASSAFSRLSDAVTTRPPDRDSALDEMTRECLRPLLKAWLDDNLPNLVERLVREEIARVVRTGR